MPRAPRLGKHNGPMDEWLSHRSAKPSTAVRIRFGPHKSLLYNSMEGIFIFYTHIYTHITPFFSLACMDNGC